jgi:nucleotide-binding universal stress UspA family protein
MLQHLIVPLDGSEHAERAVPYAVRLAGASGARVTLIRAALGPPAAGFDWERQQPTTLAGAERLSCRRGAEDRRSRASRDLRPIRRPDKLRPST